MRNPIPAAALLAALPFVPVSAAASGVNTSVRAAQEVRTCDDLEITIDGRRAERAVDRLTAPGGQKLAIQAARNGGVYVIGESRQDFAISVCKAVAPGRAIGLDQLRGTVSGGTLSATAPGSEGWVVYFIVNAPTRATVDVEATNGPIHVAHLAGDTAVRAQNGPIQLLDVTGRVTARTENGPIGYEGGGGTVDLAAQNGPLGIRLAGTTWTGGSLTASAQNGPVKLQAPRGFGSGVRVRSAQHSPWKCSGCEDSRRTWDGDARLIEFGRGPVAVTLSTENGPVAVELTR